jgi:hypothetical protein
MWMRGLRTALLVASALALVFGVVLDAYVYRSGGASFYGAIIGTEAKVESIPLWSALRDGIVSNFLFFLATGILTAVAAAKAPKDYALVQRVLALYPKLESHMALIEPFTLWARSSAVICVSSHYAVTFRRYLAESDLYELDIVRTDKILNLMPRDAVDQDGFVSEVEADIGPDDSIYVVGSVSLAHLEITKPTSGGVNMLPRGAETLTRESPRWVNRLNKVDVPADSEGTFRLTYWAYASTSIPWKARGGWPTEVLTIELRSGLGPTASIRVVVDSSEGRTSHRISNTRTEKIVLKLREPRPEITLNFDKPVLAQREHMAV